MSIYWIIVVLFAFVEANCDYNEIEYDRAIHHGRAWALRSLFAVISASLMLFFTHQAWWLILPMLVGGAALFASVHRLRLNSVRGLDLEYTSKSSAYDRLFATACGWDPLHQSWGRGPGRLAYIVEAIAYAASITITLIY